MNPWVSVFISSLVYGLTLSLIAAFVFIPASYVGNRFIYHSRWMRVVLIGVASVGSVLLFLAMIAGKFFGLQSVHYLGLLPLMSTTGNSLVDYFLQPLIQIDTDPVHMREAYQSLLLSPMEKEKTVPEELFQRGRELAAIPKLEDWARALGISLEAPAAVTTRKIVAEPATPLVASSVDLTHLGQEAQRLPGAAAAARMLGL